MKTEGIDKLFRLSAGELEAIVISVRQSGGAGAAASATWLPCGRVELAKVGSGSEAFILDMLHRFQREAGGEIEVLHLAETKFVDKPAGLLIDSGWLKLQGNRLARVLQIQESKP
ncbi:MAG: hypothetical protein HY675_03975 [Chloroflexi bacterium]|nr:hypothetical protein [Chloroflexota bacterium]